MWKLSPRASVRGPMSGLLVGDQLTQGPAREERVAGEHGGRDERA
jgi:hypothetical protein